MANDKPSKKKNSDKGSVPNSKPVTSGKKNAQENHSKFEDGGKIERVDSEKKSPEVVFGENAEEATVTISDNNEPIIVENKPEEKYEIASTKFVAPLPISQTPPVQVAYGADAKIAELTKIALEEQAAKNAEGIKAIARSFEDLIERHPRPMTKQELIEFISRNVIGNIKIQPNFVETVIEDIPYKAFFLIVTDGISSARVPRVETDVCALS